MHTLRRSFGRAGTVGRPLPPPYAALGAAEIHFRYGGTSMIAGEPGSFKSVLALNLMCIWATRHGLRTLYFSSDSDVYTVGRRVSAILTGDSTETVERLTRVTIDGRYLDALAGLSGAQFVFDTLDMDGIANRMSLFDELHGQYPDVVFVDNLMNYAASDNEWTAMRAMTRELDALARDTGAHVVTLHHTSESAGRPDWPPARSAIQGKVAQIPRLILTIAASGSELRMQCVKNTNGPQDPLSRGEPLSFRVLPCLAVVPPWHMTQGAM